MNACFGFATLTFDPLTCWKLSLTLGHSLWQVALLAGLAALVSHLWKRQSAEHSYAVHVAALLLGLIALPITFALVDAGWGRVDSVGISAKAESPRLELSAMPGADDSPSVARAAIAIPDPLPGEHFVQPQANGWLGVAPWLLAIYAIGVTVMILRLVLAFWKSHQLASHAAIITTGPLFDLLQTLARQWSVRVVPTLAQAERIVVPQVVGLLKPTILLPTAAITGLTTAELEMILAHELAHVRRLDMWIHLVQRLAEAVLFFNPSLWLLTRRISTLREYCCDEQTCRIASHETSAVRLRYAQALLRVVDLSARQFPPTELTALASSGRSPSELRRRVARLFGEPLREPVRISRGGVLTLVTGLALLLVGPLTWQTAAESRDEVSSTTKDSNDMGNSVKKLSFGGKVEVLAIGTHEEEPQKWWNAEGKLLESVPFEWNGANNVSSNEKVWRRIIFGIEGLPEGAGLTWKILGGGSSGDAKVMLKDHNDSTKYFTRYFGLGEDSNTFGLLIGISTGPWRTIIENASGMMSTGILGYSVVFSGAFPKDNGSVVIVSHDFQNFDVRVIAVDKRGTNHTTEHVRSASASEMNQFHWRFENLQPDEIDHFEFQIREYEWVEIKDLPVKPREKDDENGASWRKLSNLFESIAEKADLGLIKVSATETQQYPFWNRISNASETLATYEIVSKKQLWQTAEKLYNTTANYPEALQGVLEGLERDPFGPQVDFRELVDNHLGNHITLFEFTSRLDLPKSYVLAWSTSDALEVKRALFRFTRADPNAVLIAIKGYPVWEFKEKDQKSSALCVIDNHLIIASDVGLLKSVLSSESKASQKR